jgi:hypothetical protein
MSDDIFAWERHDVMTLIVGASVPGVENATELTSSN